MIGGRCPAGTAITLGADKAYDTADFVAGLRELNVDPARRAEHHQPPLGDRRPHHPPSRLRGQPAHPQADRGGVRLDQGDRPAAARPASRQGPRRLAVHPGGRRLQPDPAAEAAGGGMMVFGKRPRPGRQNHPSKRPPPHQLHRPNGGPHASTPPFGTISAAC